MMACFTLQSMQDDEGRDLIDEAIPDTCAYKTKVSPMLWAMFRYAILNTCDPDRWVQRATDRYTLLDNRYSVIIEAYEALKETGDLSLLESTSEELETRNLTGSSSRETSATGTSSMDSTDTSENLPQYANASSGTFLSDRGTSESSGTNSSSGTESVTTTDGGTVKRVHVDRMGSIPAEMLDRMRSSLYDPYYEYAQEFADLFVRMWADECGCGPI